MSAAFLSSAASTDLAGDFERAQAGTAGRGAISSISGSVGSVSAAPSDSISASKRIGQRRLIDGGLGQRFAPARQPRRGGAIDSVAGEAPAGEVEGGCRSRQAVLKGFLETIQPMVADVRLTAGGTK